MIGQQLSHYRISAKLGEGGMGEVYRATDTKLGRDVAIKVLPAEMAGSQERLERFQREAMALAALDHPNIVHVYSVESAECTDLEAGANAISNVVHFMTMQLVEGEPLDHWIPEKGLSVDRIVEIASAVAEALAAAHAKGIVHRDLKPANIMVTTEGRVKVLDFGLAKFAAQESDAPLETEMPTALLTREGVVMGTVPYMSPEQVAGRPLDPRSDIFSLGVVLYEMATGRRPFSGRSSAELASAILRDRPGSLIELRHDLPMGLARVIDRCLDKDPEARFGTARELCEALSRAKDVVLAHDTGVPSNQVPDPATPGREFPPSPATRGSSAASVSSAARPVDSGAARAEEGFWVAVLPFRHVGTDADVSALAGGLTEEIVTGLSRFSYLRVIARGTTEQVSDQASDVRSVGGELGAQYALEGTLRRAGKRLRVSVQLVDLGSGVHLWAESYDRDFDPDRIFALQDELAPRIVSTIADMNGVLSQRMSEAVRSRDPEQLSPYEAVLRSFGYFHRLTSDEMQAARSALELAVRKAPAYADAWAMLALLCAQEYGQLFDLLPDPLAVAADAARRAVETGPSNHLSYFSLAQVLFFQKEFQSFRNAALRAASLNPMDGNSIAFLGEMLTYAGYSDEGLELAARAKELNPHHPDWYWYTDFYHAFTEGDDGAALGFLQKVNLPGHFGLHMFKAACFGNLGESAAAAKSLARLLEIRPDFATSARRDLEKWFQPEPLERIILGLRMAGLAVPSAAGTPASRTASSELGAETVLGTSRAETPVDRIFKPPPTPVTALIGRQESLDTAVDLLEKGTRVLTITGTGGTGKTRLAIELFERMEPGVADGAAFVSLASIRSPTEVLPTVCIALDIPEAQDRSAIDALSAVLANRRVLLVLDNFEQVLDAATEVAELVSRCPFLQVIVASRAPLRIGPELEFALPPLDLPEAGIQSLEKLRQSPSVALLLQRAGRIRSDFELTRDNAGAIAAICRRLDGLPLALELAAARLRILDPAALLDRLDNSLDLLTSGDRDLPLRQRTLRATIAWSYSLLEPQEQRLLRQLAVFQDGWTLEALEQICFEARDRDRAVDELDSLVENGLVRVVERGKRYDLLETIRVFATEQLEDAGDTESTRASHADYYLQFATEIASDLRRTAQCEAMSRARADHANLQAAARWFVASARGGEATALEKGLLLCGHLNWYWHMAGHHMTGRVLIDELLLLAADADPSRGRALAWLAAGMISTTTGEWERSLGEWTRGFEDGKAIGDEEIAAEGSMGIGYCHLSGGRLDAAQSALEDAISRSSGGVSDFIQALSMTLEGMRQFAAGDLESGMDLVERALTIQRRLDDCEGGGVALSFLAQMTSAKGDQERALSLYRESLDLFERVGDRPEIARVLGEMGWTALAAGYQRDARDSFRRAVLAHEAVGSPRGTGLALLGLAAVEAAADRAERAVVIAAAADALSMKAGIVVEHPMAPEVLDRIEALKATIPHSELNGIVADASELSPAAVLAMIES